MAESLIPTPSEVIKKAKLDKSWILVSGLVILTVLLLIISITSKSVSPVPSISKNSQDNIAHTTLGISNQVRSSGIPGKYQTDVVIDSGENQITGVQLELSYDPSVLTNVDISAGDFLKDVVILRKEIDSVNGNINFTLGTAQGSDAVSGKGVLATITFTKSANLLTSIDFLPETLVTDQRYDRSVLNGTTSGNIGTLPAGR